MPMNADPSPRHPPVPRRRKRTGGYRYLLEDHPFLGPIVTLLLGGICLYSTIFSHLFEDLFLPAGSDATSRGNFGLGTSWGVAFAIAIMFLALVFLIWTTIETAIRRRHLRQPVTCPRCGRLEGSGALRFAHAVVEGTGWEEITCPQCRHAWHRRL